MTSTALPPLTTTSTAPRCAVTADPRIDPAMAEALTSLGLGGLPEGPPPVRSTDPLDSVLGAVGGAHEAFQGLYESIALPNPGVGDTVEVTRHASSGAGQDEDLTIFRPRGVDGPLPGVVYLHGGGMTILTADNPVHRRWCEDLAAAGAVVVLVEYRNAWTETGHHPFPAGLQDCLRAVDWVHRHRADLGIASLVVQGESGGANLALATTLLAGREGVLDMIDGVHTSVPYISGGYDWDEDRRLASLPSLAENDGYFIDTAMMALLVRTYDPDGSHREDPLAWPYFATEGDLAGFPPTVISVNELDPLRDEGVVFARKLAAVAAPVSDRMNFGIVHGAELIFGHWLPAARKAAVRDIVAFATERMPST